MNINNQFLPKAVRYPGIILVFIFVGISCSQQTPSIYEPTVVGTPPRNAYIGLMRLDNGEIRHYTYSDNNKENRPFYIRSRDNGLTWDTVFVDNEWTGADVKSPVSGEYIRLLSTDSGVVCTRSNGGIDGTWHTLRFEWNLNETSNDCKVFNGDGDLLDQLPLNRTCVNGISYVHFISDAKQPDEKGFFVGRVYAGES